MLVKGRIDTSAGARFFIGSDGHLYDTAMDNWWKKPIRKDYSKHFREIETPAQLKASLREGPYAWPGGYDLYFICSDGGVLCHPCTTKNIRNIIYSMISRLRDGWWVVHQACTNEFDDYQLICDNCNKVIFENPEMEPTDDES